MTVAAQGAINIYVLLTITYRYAMYDDDGRPNDSDNERLRNGDDE
jgi:uncharacterized membrane protein